MDKVSEESVRRRKAALGKKVGKAIADRRRAVPMTQEELAERLGVGVEAVSRMERGAIMPSIPKLVEVAEALHSPVQDLLLMFSDRPTDKGIELAKKLDQLSPSDREMVLQIVDLLAHRLKQ